MSRADDLFDRLVAGGEPEVLAFIAQPVTEELFLDYKCSADNGGGNALHNRDRANLAKAISGFGNSEGGVIVWGVDCRQDPVLGDVPDQPVHIQNPTRFKSWLEQATSGLTVPAHNGVRHHPIVPGFVVTLIPSGAHAPYQTVNDQSYYIRAGSSFVRAPHAVLAGLFGRRPQPAVKHTWLMPEIPARTVPEAVRTDLSIMLRNFGRGVAEDVFLNLTMMSSPGPNCEIEFLPSQEQDVWWGRFALGREVQLVMRRGFVLPPDAYVVPLTLGVTLREPIQGDFEFEATCGSSGGESWKFGFRAEVGVIVEAVDRLFRTPLGAFDAASLERRFNRLFFRSIPDVT